jgi:hypothetical protein
MADPRDEKDDAPKPGEVTGHLVQGLGHLWRAARGAASGIRKEVDQTHARKTLDDAGRELQRAVTNVVRRLGAEIEKASGGHESTPHSEGIEMKKPAPWPTTREEYERKYGPIAGDWPKTPAEYEKKYGVPPHDPNTKPKGPTPSDPGFYIAGDDDKPQ